MHVLRSETNRKGVYNPPSEKGCRLFILPQYPANLTQPKGTLKTVFFVKGVPVLTILCMLGSKFLELFYAFLETLLELSYAKNYG